MSVADIPEEILEYIFLRLSPYGDIKSAMLVCRQWYHIAKGVVKKMYHGFHNNIKSGELKWLQIPPEPGPTISERYSHCACYFDKSVYVFGGCTSTNATFNDLWRFDLACRQWIRPLAMGTYPTPKACASMVVYQDSLVLFGGWSHPTPYPLHQAARFFQELHVYIPITNRWSQVTPMSQAQPKPIAGHSASVVGDTMIVFGGSQVPGQGTNEVWMFDFLEMCWKKPDVSPPFPAPRYGQSQVTIDDHHVLIFGGCVEPRKNKVFSDFWLLNMESEPWTWKEIKVLNPENAAPQLWSHPACKVGESLCVLSKPSKTLASTPHIQLQTNKVWIPPREAASQRLLPSPQQKVGHPPQSVEPDRIAPSHGQRGFNASATEPRACAHTQQVVQVSAGAESIDTVSTNEPGPSCVNSQYPERPDSSAVPGPSRVTTEDPVLKRHLPDSSESSDSSPDESTMMNKDFKFKIPELPRNRHAPNHLPSIRPNAMKDRQKQLEVLRKYEELFKGKLSAYDSPKKIENSRGPSASAIPKSSVSTNVCIRDCRSLMQLHVLDISNVVTEATVSWQHVNEMYQCDIPEETKFYSVVEGRGELIMFGGIQQDLRVVQGRDNLRSQAVSNNLYIIGSKLQQL